MIGYTDGMLTRDSYEQDWHGRIPQTAVEHLLKSIQIIRDFTPNASQVPLEVPSLVSVTGGRNYEKLTDAQIVEEVKRLLQTPPQAYQVMFASSVYANGRMTLPIAKGLLVEVRKYGYGVYPDFL